MSQLFTERTTTSGYCDKGKRSNEQWLSELRCVAGQESQQRAIQALSRYMYVVAHNALLKRRARYSKLVEMDQEALQALAEDFAQEVMVKLARNEFALLDQFDGRGNFTSWVAMIVSNEVASELRKVRWQRVKQLTIVHEATLADDNGPSPEALAVHSCLSDALTCAIATLAPNLRTALIRCVLNEEKAAVVAEDLGVTANAVYSLVHRAKRALQAELVDYQLS